MESDRLNQWLTLGANFGVLGGAGSGDLADESERRINTCSDN